MSQPECIQHRTLPVAVQCHVCNGLHVNRVEGNASARWRAEGNKSRWIKRISELECHQWRKTCDYVAFPDSIKSWRLQYLVNLDLHWAASSWAVHLPW